MLSPITESEESYSPLRLLRLRQEQSGKLNEDGLRLIDRAIYSTYCDAVDLGVVAEAQRLLHRFAVPAKAQQAQTQ
jgi:hypothetical protein